MKLTLDSRVHELYAHPLGHDIVDKLLLQSGKPPWLVNNSIVGSLRLRTLKRLAGKRVSEQFFDILLGLLNTEPDRPRTDTVSPEPAWWKEAVFYQVYPRFFTGEGLKGIINKLDYLKGLGVDAIWLSPVYDSPNDDNGYDIRDYYKIMKELGDMDDMDALISGLHARGMKLIMDLVVNHTSDEHEWFKEALNNPCSPYRDFYFFRKTTNAGPPNNWTSFFGGPAWNYYPEQDVWALHLFSKKQMDLNWECKAMRQELYKMVRWWFEKGVDGFRLDVINYISKTDCLPDGDEFIGALMKYAGVERYFYGPKLHEYLRELKKEAFLPYGAFSVGETPGIGLMGGRLLTDTCRGELDLIFSFDHLETPGHSRFDEYVYDLSYLKTFYMKHLNADLGHGWHTLFFNNHDNPRMVSKIDPGGAYRVELAKLLAVLQMTLKGTPFIYQGDETGTPNEEFTSMEELKDVESHGMYAAFLNVGLSHEAAFKRILAGTRDHARAMMKWDEVQLQQGDEESVFEFYRKLITWRRNTAACIYGALEFIDKKDKHIFRYRRVLDGVTIHVEANLRSKGGKSMKPAGSRYVLGSHKNNTGPLRAYEARIYSSGIL